MRRGPFRRQGFFFEKRNDAGEIEDGAAQTLKEYAHLHAGDGPAEYAAGTEGGVQA